MSSGVTWLGTPTFPTAAAEALTDTQMRRNLSKATHTIRNKREPIVGELADWQDLREAGEAIKNETLANLDTYLIQLEETVRQHGGTVHWARDGDEANDIVIRLTKQAQAREVVKIKSMTTAETALNEALESAGIHPVETDLAELIIQLGQDRPSHILVPAIHRNRSEIQDIFLRKMPDVDSELSADPSSLAEAARHHLRKKFLSSKVAISGANFAVAETGSVAIFESEGNGRMCLTMPETLITVMGIEKVIPRWRDLEVFLQLLPRSSTAERMNPYTSIFTGVTPGDGPQEFHLVLLDNGRTETLSDPVGRQALRCIRCSACLNVCPVYERTGGQAYGSVYPGPIGAILAPQLHGGTNPGDMRDEQSASLPYASSLCGACYEVCPVRINIPETLVHLRSKSVAAKPKRSPESLAMTALAWIFRDPRRYVAAQRLGKLARLIARGGKIRHIPYPGTRWTASRDAPAPAPETFREWWRKNRG